MRNVCLIPARSGSKGLKDKNMAFLNNKPLIQHTVEAMIKSKLCAKEDIYISTDSKEYISHLEGLGVTILLRDKELASDNSSTSVVVMDFLSKFEENVNLILLQPTSPLRTEKHILEAFDIYKKNIKDSIVVSVVKSDKSPDLFSRMNQNDELIDIIGIDKGYCRQNYEDLYCPNGAIYIVAKSTYLTSKSFFTNKTIGYEMSKRSSIDIDDYVDFEHVIGATYFDYGLRDKQNYSMYEKLFKSRLNEVKSKIILGDSRSQPLSIDGYSNLSMGGVTIITVNKLVQRYLKTQKIKKVVINLGINDIIVGNKEEEYFESLRTLVNSFNNAEIVILNCFPTIYRPNVDNDQVKRLNEFIDQFTNVEIIDAFSEFEVNSKLNFWLTNDGLHLNSEGCKVLNNLIKDV